MNLQEFNSIKTNLTKFIALEGIKRLNSRIYGLSNCACNEKFRREAILYAFALNSYQMNKSGSLTGLYNYITQEELQNIIVRVKRLSQEL